MNLKDFPRPPNDNGRGVHGPPGAHPNGFLTEWDFWSDQLQAMNIRWVKMLDPGDGAALPLAEKLVSIGIMPVVRFFEERRYPGRARADREIATMRDYVSIGAYYCEINNEPDLAEEWKDNKRPENWLEIVVDNFIAHADMVRGVGGFLLFPAFGPGGKGDPFQMIVDRGRADLFDGNMCLAIHNYGLGRPLEYPNDPVNLYGQPLTQAEWEATALDKKAGDGPLWAWEMSWETVNEHRQQLANPDANIFEDSTCFRAYEYFDRLINDACGHSIPIMMTEGGYNVGQRAGTTFGDIPNFPKPSPQRVAELTLEMFKWTETGPDYYFASMPWLIAVDRMGYWQPDFRQQGPWYSFDFEHDWENCDGGELPVVQLLKNNPGQKKGEVMRRPGLWVANGHPGQTVEQMLSWKPGALTCFYDYLGPNRIREYKQAHPGATVIVRFQHPMNWRDDIPTSASNQGREIASKWSDLKDLDPYVYFANEINLHYENGDPDIGNQWKYETREFYEDFATWVDLTARVIKDRVPEMKLVCPPFAYGHHEDGAPNDEGEITEEWAGYDFLSDTIQTYFDNIICGHYYWGDATGRKAERLHDPVEASWHALRWRRVLKMFKARYNIDARMIIDEAGCFEAGHPAFTEDCFFYAGQCLTDERILALTFFLWLDPTNSPGNVPNSWVQQRPEPALTRHLERLKVFHVDTPPEEPPPEPEPEPEPEPPAEWEAILESREGLPLLTGDWFQGSGIELTLTDPWGNRAGTLSGNKPEYGTGGFEFYARDEGIYFLEGGDHTFDLELDGRGYWVRFIKKESELAFDHRAKIEEFLASGSVIMPDTKYQVRLIPAQVEVGKTYWKAIGVYHLLPEENNWNHHVYLEALDGFGNRIDPPVQVKWGWEGQGEEEVSPPIVLDKPLTEPAGNITLHWDQRVWVEIDGPIATDRVENLHIMHPDEPVGNSRGHHSFFVAWQLTTKTGEEPPPEPPPDENRAHVALMKVKALNKEITTVISEYEAGNGSGSILDWFRRRIGL